MNCTVAFQVGKAIQQSGNSAIIGETFNFKREHKPHGLNVTLRNASM